MKKLNSKGVGTLEVILIVAVVVLLGAVGYLYFKNQNKAPAASNTTASTKNTKTSDTSKSLTDSTKYVTITQWSVRAPYDGSSKLIYKIGNNGNTAYFSTSELEAAGELCESGGYGGAISRYKPSELYESSDMTAEQMAAQNPTLFKKIGDYYYSYVGPQARCVDNDKDIGLQITANKDVNGLISKLQGIPENQ